MKLTYLQQLWLTSRGDRTPDDVVIMGDGMYVLMRSRGEWKAIEIPSHDRIIREYDVIHKEYRPPLLQNKFQCDIR